MSRVAAPSGKWEIVARPYPPEGCLVNIGKEKCGETKGLDIISDFQKLYQEKMKQIDVSAGGDSLQEKVILQQEWINDLTEQNKMLARVIEELEMEAIGRVKQLEDKLKNAAKSFGEENSPAKAEQDQKIKELEEHFQNLQNEKVEHVKEQKKEEEGIEETKLEAHPLPKDIEKVDTVDTLKEEEEIPESAPAAPEKPKDIIADSNLLQQSILEIRAALTEEMAIKLDTISQLKNELVQLEERNIDILKEISLKDDIIKELRKEVKKTKNKIVTDTKKEAGNIRTLDKSTNTAMNEYLTLSHSREQEPPNNSRVIFIRREHNYDRSDPSSTFDSSDSSECGLTENFKISRNGLVHSCRSENDMKPIDWMKPIKERTKFTKFQKNEEADYRRSKDGTKLNIPKHIPVKTYVNNIEYSKDIE